MRWRSPAIPPTPSSADPVAARHSDRQHALGGRRLRSHPDARSQPARPAGNLRHGRQRRSATAIVEPAGMTLLVPDETVQARVMASIYGDRGSGRPHLGRVQRAPAGGDRTSSQSAAPRAIILGCTELPLIEPRRRAAPIDCAARPDRDPREKLRGLARGSEPRTEIRPAA